MLIGNKNQNQKSCICFCFVCLIYALSESEKWLGHIILTLRFFFFLCPLSLTRLRQHNPTWESNSQGPQNVIITLQVSEIGGFIYEMKNIKEFHLQLLKFYHQTLFWVNHCLSPPPFHRTFLTGLHSMKLVLLQNELIYHTVFFVTKETKRAWQGETHQEVKGGALAGKNRQTSLFHNFVKSSFLYDFSLYYNLFLP